MNHWERLERLLAGEEIDRAPASFWRHFFPQETTAAGLAQAMVEFQKRFDWDFVKLNARSTYYAEAYGTRFDYGRREHDHPVRQEPRFHQVEQIDELEPAEAEKGVLGEHLQAIRLIVQRVAEDVPVIMTIFSPISILGGLLVRDQDLAEGIGKDPDRIHRALERIAGDFAAFTGACLEAGAKGIFFATTGWGSRDSLSDELYDEFARPYDLQVLEAAAEAPFNILHVCGGHNRLETLLDYPVQAINWDATEATNPSLKAISKQTDKLLIGGLDQKETLLSADSQDAVRQLEQARDAAGGKRWIVGAGCAISTHTPNATLWAVRQALEDLTPT